MSQSEFQLITLTVGPWSTNCYLLVSEGESFIVDPAAEGERILAAAQGARVKGILLTHAHGDHIQALEMVRQATGAPLWLHPADAAEFGIAGGHDLAEGQRLKVGEKELTVLHTPGHTPGSVCFYWGEGAIVGDTLFPGGPGHSRSPEALSQILSNLEQKLFVWPDATLFYPGHGEGSSIGAVRPAFEAFMARERPADLHGDVEW